MIRSIALATLSAVAIAAGAHAQDTSSFKLSAGYDRADFDGGEFDTVALRGTYDFSDFFGMEAQTNFGFNDESGVELNYSAGLFGVVRANISENGGPSNVFFRAGYTITELSGGGLTADDTAFAYGVGGEFFMDDRNGFRIDYTRMDFDDGGDASVYGVSYVRRFGG